MILALTLIFVGTVKVGMYNTRINLFIHNTQARLGIANYQITHYNKATKKMLFDKYGIDVNKITILKYNDKDNFTADVKFNLGFEGLFTMRNIVIKNMPLYPVLQAAIERSNYLYLSYLQYYSNPAHRTNNGLYMYYYSNEKQIAQSGIKIQIVKGGIMVNFCGISKANFGFDKYSKFYATNPSIDKVEVKKHAKELKTKIKEQDFLIKIPKSKDIKTPAKNIPPKK